MSNSDKSSAGSASANTVISLSREARIRRALVKLPSEAHMAWPSAAALASDLPAPSTSSKTAPEMASRS